jgi:hypothetical protein
MRAIERVVATTAVTMLVAVGCSTQGRSAGGDTARKTTIATPSATSEQAPTAAHDTISAQARIARLEADARALVKTTGCNSATECHTAPVGERACGGPRDYVVYCPATTDTVALFKKLDELKAAEIEYNKSSNAMSTCEFRMPPKTSLIGGSCRQAASP